MKPHTVAALASLAVRRAAQAERREQVRALLADHPHMSTDEIALILGVDRSTVRNDRKKIGLALARGSAAR